MLFRVRDLRREKTASGNDFPYKPRGLAGGDQGLTLLEVLLSLMITGVIVVMVFSIYLPQYRLLNETTSKAEAQFVLLKAGQVLASALSTADTITWTGSTLRVTARHAGKVNNDSYYLADKDHNGKLDLYRERLGVPTPIVTGLKEFHAVQNHNGLWTITVTADSNIKTHKLEKKVRQRLWQE